MNLGAWLNRLAPDFVVTGRRFPFAILLAAAMTAVALFAINPPSSMVDGLEPWFRAVAGLATGAVLAVAGVFFAESRPDAKKTAFVLKYLLPLAAAAVFQVTSTFWVFPWLLPGVAILWLSVSPFTWIGRGPEQEAQQNLFWWVNHHAVATAAIAAVAFAIIAAGLIAIERSLSVLFNLDSSRIFYQWVLPFTGLFLTPVYWLSTLPRVAGVPAREAENPGFTSNAIGFLGQFVLVPLLLIYGVILLVYTGQIAITQQLPQGMIGWMVLGFVVTGAATWLVLHPRFMREKPLVKLFRRFWFWLTLIPLALFFFAVWVRVDAYGLTAERVLLLAGGLWASVLSVLFLSGRGDIRVIPGLAAALLLLMSVGPWNYVNLSLEQQLGRLDALVMNAGADKSASPPRGDWSAAEIAEATSLIDYLSGVAPGRAGVRSLMGKYGVTWASDRDGSWVVLPALGFEPYGTLAAKIANSLYRNEQPVQVAATPYYLRRVIVSQRREVTAALQWTDEAREPEPAPKPKEPALTIRDGRLRVERAAAPDDASVHEVELADFISRQAEDALVDPWVDFAFDGVSYRIVVDAVEFVQGENEGGRVVVGLQGQLFADRAE